MPSSDQEGDNAQAVAPAQFTATTQTVPPPNFRSTADYDSEDKIGPNFTDHFSLRHPSSTVRFRGARVHVYEAGYEQILLEDRRSFQDTKNEEVTKDDGDNGKSRRQHRHTITVKRMNWSGLGLRTLRLAYALIALLLVGFAFVLCFQIVLFLFLNLPVDANASSIEARKGRARVVGTLLSVPVFLFGMASLMAIGSTFVSDCWQGGPLIRAVSGLPSLVTEVLFFVFFILVPALTAVVSLMAQYENPWEVTCRAWCLSVAFAFCIFGLGIVYREVQACLQLVSIYFDDISVEDQGNMPAWKKWMPKVQRSVILTTMQRYSGHKNEQYLVTGEDVAPEGGFTFCDKHKPRQSKQGLYTRLTQMKCLGCIFDTIDPPKRLYTIEEVRDVLPFVTRHNWSLESMFCRKNRERGIVSAKGPSALTSDQVKASVVCNVGATTLVSLIVIALLVWFNAGTMVYVFGAIISVLCCILPLVRSSTETVAMYKDINTTEGIGGSILDDEEAFVDEADVKDGATPGDEKSANEEDRNFHKAERRTMFQLWETTRVAQPKEWTCYSLISFEFIFFFLYPMCVLFITHNYPVAVVFIIVSIIAMLRKYFDPSAILCELGSMNDVDVETNPGEGELYTVTGRAKSLKGSDKTLVLKSRLADIVGSISRSAATTRWMYFFGTLVLLVFLLFLQAINSDDGLGERPPIVLVDDFYYPGEETLQYPTCELSKGFKIGSSDTALGDYSMLSALAYETTNVTDYLLPQYFGGEGIAIDEDEFVTNYRDDSGTASVPVYFKFITFPRVPNLGVVAIRGSQTSWDWVVNMQLWSAAGLAQVVKVSCRLVCRLNCLLFFTSKNHLFFLQLLCPVGHPLRLVVAPDP